MRIPQVVVALLLLAGTVPVEVRAEEHAEGHADRSRPRIEVEAINPWTSLDLLNDPEAFQFAIVTDRTGGHRPGVFPDAVRKLNLLQPEFVMSVGDLIEGYTEDRHVLRTQWEEFVGFVEDLDMPFFYVPGNHDITNPVMADVWAERFGRSYYHFVYRDVLFVCLNTEDTAPQTIGDDQVEWLRGVLGDNTDVRWTLVFQHKPLWNYTEAGSEAMHATWGRIETLLADRPHTVFAGHYHAYTKHTRNGGRSYFVLATTGGGSGLQGPLFGQFDHVVWVTMTAAGPRIANLMLEGIWDENVRTEQMTRMMAPLLSGRAVSMVPVFTEGKRFAGADTKLRLTNDGDTPLRIRASFVEHPYLAPTPAQVEVEVPPNSVELVDLRVDAMGRPAVDELAPLVLTWSAQFPAAEPALPAVEGESRLAVTRKYDIGRRRRAVTVDGDLEEWKDFGYRVQAPAEIDVAPDSWQGADDCSWRFAVEMDDENLYLAVEVTDERRVYLGRRAWQQDGLEVRFDARPDPQRSQSRDDGGVLAVAISPAADPADMEVQGAQALAEQGVFAAGISTPTGHAYEVSIPLAYIEARQGADWREVRLNMAVDDFDDESGPLAQLWWQPDWRDETTFAGSGTFRRPKR